MSGYLKFTFFVCNFFQIRSTRLDTKYGSILVFLLGNVRSLSTILLMGISIECFYICYSSGYCFQVSINCFICCQNLENP